jgi:hypothetical protein
MKNSDKILATATAIITGGLAVGYALLPTFKSTASEALSSGKAAACLSQAAKNYNGGPNNGEAKPSEKMFCSVNSQYATLSFGNPDKIGFHGDMSMGPSGDLAVFPGGVRLVDSKEAERQLGNDLAQKYTTLLQTAIKKANGPG